MRFLLDTNVLLNDFFHRHPDFGFQRIQNPEQAGQVEAYRLEVHEGLLFLSLQKGVEVWTSVSILARLGALLGDLLVPADLVLEEMEHWLSQLKLVELPPQHLHEAIEAMKSAETRLDFDDYLLKNTCKSAGIEAVVSSLPKPKEFYWPILVFKPEKLRELKFEIPGSIQV